MVMSNNKIPTISESIRPKRNLSFNGDDDGGHGDGNGNGDVSDD